MHTRLHPAEYSCVLVPAATISTGIHMWLGFPIWPWNDDDVLKGIFRNWVLLNLIKLSPRLSYVVALTIQNLSFFSKLHTFEFENNTHIHTCKKFI
jgi:hypothetical protein